MKPHFLPFFILIAAMPEIHAQTTLPPDTAYVVTDENGHLSVDERRQRFWAITGIFFAQPKLAASYSSEIRA